MAWKPLGSEGIVYRIEGKVIYLAIPCKGMDTWKESKAGNKRITVGKNKNLQVGKRIITLSLNAWIYSGDNARQPNDSEIKELNL